MRAYFHLPLVAWIALSTGGCSFIIDSEGLDVTHVGDPPSLATLFTYLPARDALFTFLVGIDGEPWIIEGKDNDHPLGVVTGGRSYSIGGPAHLQRFQKGATPAGLDGNAFLAFSNVIYAAQYAADNRHGTWLYLIRPGDSDGPRSLESVSALVISDDGQLYATPTQTDDAVLVTSADQSWSRSFRTAFGAHEAFNSISQNSPEAGSPAQLWPHWLLLPQTAAMGKSRLRSYTAYSLYDERTIDLRLINSDSLGSLSGILVEHTGYLPTCRSDGLEVFYLDGRAPRHIDTGDCVLLGIGEDGLISYFNIAAHQVWQVPGDGSSPPQKTQRVPAPTSANAIGSAGPFGMPYTTTPHPGEAHDGWLEGWQFMQRGRDSDYSRDKTRIIWLEGTARLYPSGDLYTQKLDLPLGSGQRLHLAYNAYDWAELSDGRLLVDDHKAEPDADQDLEVIDMVSRVAKTMAVGVADHKNLPGTSDLLVRLQSPQVDPELLIRIPIPNTAVGMGE